MNISAVNLNNHFLRTPRYNPVGRANLQKPRQKIGFKANFVMNPHAEKALKEGIKKINPYLSWEGIYSKFREAVENATRRIPGEIRLSLDPNPKFRKIKPAYPVVSYKPDKPYNKWSNPPRITPLEEIKPDEILTRRDGRILIDPKKLTKRIAENLARRQDIDNYANFRDLAKRL